MSLWGGNEHALPSFDDQIAAQEQLQRMGGEDNIKPYLPDLQEKMAQAQAVVIAQTDPLKVLENIKLQLEGKIKKSDDTIEVMREPIMNEFGIGRVMFLMSAVINDNTRFSHFDERQVRKLILKLADDLTNDLAERWRDYDISDRSMCDFIIDAIVIPSFAVLMRALEQNEKNWIGRIAFESINQAPNKKKEGIIDKLRL